MKNLTRESGAHPSVPFSEYMEWQAVSRSKLWTMRQRTPAHAQIGDEAESSEALNLGIAVHEAILQPDIFKAHYGTALHDGRTSAGKEERAEADARGVELIPREKMCLVDGMRESVHRHPIARISMDTARELSILWSDDAYGIRCKARLDAVGYGGEMISDLKTTTDASPRSFERAMYTFGYFLQAAHYLKGAQAIGIPAEHFCIIAVEKQPPFAVAIYRVMDEIIAIGERERNRLLSLYWECETKDNWPGYGDGIRSIGLPDWAIRELESTT